MKGTTNGCAANPGLDFYGTRPPPPKPTYAQPGTAEKIAVMRQREASHFLLYHPLDAKRSWE